MRLMPYFFAIAFLCITHTSLAQHYKKRIKQRFKAGLVLGITASQVDGDNYIGFDKRGIQGGIFGEAVLTKQISLLTELFYTPRGAKIEVGRTGYNPKDRIIHLAYMEVPIVFQFKTKADGLGYFLETGMSYSRLFDKRINEDFVPAGEVSYKVLSDEFKSGEFSFLAGLGYQFSKHLGLKLRYSLSVTNFYQNPNFADLNASSNISRLYSFDPYEKIRHLRNYQLSLLGIFTF